MPPSRSHFVTGFPGFIGRRLVAKLLADDSSARVVTLVEERMRDAAQACADKIGADRIEIVVGDITDRKLGLDEKTYDRLAAETTMVFHLAAIYNLSVPLEVATRINVDGTGNVVEFCRAAPGLK